MKNFVVNVSTKTSKVYLEETSIAVDGENIAGQVIFKFNDEEFIDGIARLEWQNGSDKYFQLMNKVGKTYELPIKNVMTKEGKMYFQLVITQQAIGEEIPVFKSNQFYVFVEKSINAEGEAPSGYDTWLDYANAKLIEMDNLNIDVTKSGNTATITLTDKQGQSTETYIYDGENGQDGKDGVDGKDAKINGVNTLNIVAGENITIDQVDDTLTINGEAGGDAKVKDVTVNGTSVVENKIAKVIVPTKVGDLQNDSGFITNTVNNLTNYYLKTETYTKTEINTIIGNIETITLEIVEELPVTGESNKIYLVPKEGSTNDVYDEYLYIDNDWEHIGSTEVDLSNYYTKTETNAMVQATSIFYAKRTEIFATANPGQSTNTTIDSDDLTEYNAACVNAKQFLPLSIKSSDSTGYINFYIYPRIRMNGNLQYSGFAFKNDGKFYKITTSEIASPVIGSLVRSNLVFTTYTIAIDTGDKIQVTTLPTAGASQENKIYQYIGTDTADYKNGYFYKCIKTVVPAHIVTNGGAHVPIGLYANNNRIEMLFKYTGYNYYYSYLFDTDAGTPAVFIIGDGGEIGFVVHGSQSSYYIPNLKDSQIHKMFYNGEDGAYGIDDNTLGSYTSTENDYPIFLFSDGNTQQCFVGEFYELKTYDKTTGNLTHEYKPISVSGTPAIYDNIGHQTYYDENNTMTFVAESITYAWTQYDTQPSDYAKTNDWKWTDYTIIKDPSLLKDLQWIIDGWTTTGLPNYWLEGYHLQNAWENTSSLEDDYRHIIMQFVSVTGSNSITERYIYVYTHYNTNIIYDNTSENYAPQTVSTQQYTFAQSYELNNYLSIYNTTEYTPTSDYNPATKKYADSVKKYCIRQYTTLPTPNDTGELAQYIGTDGIYRKNSFYQMTPDATIGTPVLRINGDSHFTLNYQFQSTDKLEIKFKPIMENPMDSGVIGNEENNYQALEMHFNGTIFYVGSGEQEHAYYDTYVQNMLYIVTLNDDSDIVINNETKETGVTFTSNATLQLFDYQSNTGFRGDFYYLKIWDTTTGTLKKEWLPALDQNDVPCIYESVGGTYIYNTLTPETPNQYLIVYNTYYWKLVNDFIEPTRVNNVNSTYTIDNLEEHYLYNLGEITSLTITDIDNIYIETNIFLESGNTATTVSLPTGYTHIGDAPTFTTASNVDTGTLTANKKYIISFLNGIAVWKEY